GDEFDDVGCSVAQQPGGTSHGTRSAQAREGAGGGLPGSEGGSAGTSGDGGPYGGKAETLKAESRNGKVGEGESRKQKVESRNGLQDCGGEAEEGLRTTGLKDPGLQDYGGKAEEGLRTTGPRTTGLRGQEGEAFPINLLKQVLDSTLEQQAAIERILGERCFADRQKGTPTTPKRVSANRPCSAGAFKAAIEGDPTSGSFSIRVSLANEVAQAAPL